MEKKIEYVRIAIPQNNQEVLDGQKGVALITLENVAKFPRGYIKIEAVTNKTANVGNHLGIGYLIANTGTGFVATQVGSLDADRVFGLIDMGSGSEQFGIDASQVTVSQKTNLNFVAQSDNNNRLYLWAIALGTVDGTESGETADIMIQWEQF